MTRVLFICTGNTCRSPMAELYFDHRCRQVGLCDVSAASAGVCTVPGIPISGAAREVLAELGIDAGEFRSRLLDREMLRAADLVVAMGSSHRAALAAAYPGLGIPVRLLLEFSGGGSVPDPWGSGADVYRSVFAVMRPALEELIRRLAAGGKNAPDASPGFFKSGI